MRRVNHDIPGLGQRIERAAEKLQAAILEVEEVWKDDRGRDFLQRYTSEVSTTVKQLSGALSSAVESFESISRQLQDPDRA
jgi:hypothetical protein